MITGTCYHCQRDVELSLLRDDKAWHTLCSLLLTLPGSVQVPVWRYLELFIPAKHSTLRSSRMLTIVKELAPMIKTGTLKQGKKSYTIGVLNWEKALTYLVETPPKTMALPLKGNGYLLALMVSRAEQLEDKKEQDKDAQLRNAPARADNDGAQGFDIDKWKAGFTGAAHE